MKLCVRKWQDLNVTLLVLSAVFILNFIFG